MAYDWEDDEKLRNQGVVKGEMEAQIALKQQQRVLEEEQRKEVPEVCNNSGRGKQTDPRCPPPRGAYPSFLPYLVPLTPARPPRSPPFFSLLSVCITISPLRGVSAFSVTLPRPLVPWRPPPPPPPGALSLLSPLLTVGPRLPRVLGHPLAGSREPMGRQ